MPEQGRPSVRPFVSLAAEPKLFPFKSRFTAKKRPKLGRTSDGPVESNAAGRHDPAVEGEDDLVGEATLTHLVQVDAAHAAERLVAACDARVALLPAGKTTGKVQQGAAPTAHELYVGNLRNFSFVTTGQPLWRF